MRLNHCEIVLEEVEGFDPEGHQVLTHEKGQLEWVNVGDCCVDGEVSEGL